MKGARVDNQWQSLKVNFPYPMADFWLEFLKHDGAIIIGRVINIAMPSGAIWCAIVSPNGNIYRPNQFTNYRDVRDDNEAYQIGAITSSRFANLGRYPESLRGDVNVQAIADWNRKQDEAKGK